MEKRAKEAPRDWALGLPLELLASVLDYLTSTDHARFAAVCTSWRSAAREARRQPAPQAPWLLLRPSPHDDEDDDGDEEEEEDDDDGVTHRSFRFFRPLDRKVHIIRRPLPPEFRWRSVVGVSPDGWVILVNGRRELRALNPVTGARCRLPRLATIPKGYAKKCAKVVMSSPYARRPRAAVFVAFLCGRQRSGVALATAGDTKWSLLDTAALGSIHDLAFYEGEFYILGEMPGGNPHEGTLRIAVVGGGGRDLSSPPEVMVVGPTHPEDFCFRLVVTASGDLLLVFCSIENSCRCCRLDLLQDGDGGRVARSVPLGDLGDHALLLANECSMLVSTRQVPELRRNCIYNYNGVSPLVMFNLDDGSIESVAVDGRIEAAWFMPGVL